MNEKDFIIEGMSCNHCVMAVKKELSALALESSEVEIGRARVRFDESKVTAAEIENAISEAGFKLKK